MKKSVSGEMMLQPSFWRTCRALKNRHRLDLLRDVFSFEGEFGVTAFGRRAGISEPTASAYLRQLNARGLIGVRRERKFVYYNTERDRSLPKAISLQSAFIDYFKTDLKGDWQGPLLKLLKAYTHFNRIRAIRYLAGVKSAAISQLESHMGVCVRGVYHHIRILVDSGVLEPAGDRSSYRLVKPRNPVHKVLHNLAMSCCD